MTMLGSNIKHAVISVEYTIWLQKSNERKLKPNRLILYLYIEWELFINFELPFLFNCSWQFWFFFSFYFWSLSKVVLTQFP